MSSPKVFLGRKVCNNIKLTSALKSHAPFLSNCWSNNASGEQSFPAVEQSGKPRGALSAAVWPSNSHPDSCWPVLIAHRRPFNVWSSPSLLKLSSFTFITFPCCCFNPDFTVKKKKRLTAAKDYDVCALVQLALSKHPLTSCC